MILYERSNDFFCGLSSRIQNNTPEISQKVHVAAPLKKSKYASLQKKPVINVPVPEPEIPEIEETQEDPLEDVPIEDFIVDETVKNQGKEPPLKKRKVAKRENFSGFTAGDLAKYGFLSFVSKFDKPGSSVHGLTKRFKENGLWNDAFDETMEKYAKIPVEKFGPEGALILSTGFIVASAVVYNATGAEICPSLPKEEENENLEIEENKE